MPTSRLGRIAAITCFAVLLALCLSSNAYLAYRLNYPPRTLQIRIVYDPSSPPLPGLLPTNLKAQVESLSGFFEQAAGIRIAVTGFTKLTPSAQIADPDALRRHIDLRTPRDNADILLAFWGAPPGDPRLGSALPFTSVAVVRMDAGNAVGNKASLAHQLLTLFGVPASTDAQSVMHTPPTALKLDPASAKDFFDLRLFDFHRGLGGMNRRLQNNVLASTARYLKAHPPADRSRTSRIVLAELLMRDSQFQVAIEQYRAALRSDSNSLPAHLGLSLALTQTSQYKEAEAEARAALKLAPDQGDAHYRLGFVLVRAGNPEAAIPELRQAVTLQPKSIRNRTGLAVAYAASVGEFETADREFQEALKLEPQNQVLLADIEYVSRLRIRYGRELEAADNEIRVHSDNASAHERASLLSLRLGRTDRAITEAREAIRIAPETWRPHYALAMALLAGRDYEGSSAALADAKKLGSGDRPFLEDSLRAAANSKK